MRNWYSASDLILAIGAPALLGFVPLLLARPLLSQNLRWWAMFALIALWLAMNWIVRGLPMFFINAAVVYAGVVFIRWMVERKVFSISIADAFFLMTWTSLVSVEMAYFIRYPREIRSWLPYEAAVLSGILASILVDRFKRSRGYAMVTFGITYLWAIYAASPFYVPTDSDTHFLKTQVAAAVVPAASAFFASFLAIQLARRWSALPKIHGILS